MDDIRRSSRRTEKQIDLLYQKMVAMLESQKQTVKSLHKLTQQTLQQPSVHGTAENITAEHITAEHILAEHITAEHITAEHITAETMTSDTGTRPMVEVTAEKYPKKPLSRSQEGPAVDLSALTIPPREATSTHTFTVDEENVTFEEHSHESVTNMSSATFPTKNNSSSEQEETSDTKYSSDIEMNYSKHLRQKKTCTQEDNRMALKFAISSSDLIGPSEGIQIGSNPADNLPTSASTLTSDESRSRAELTNFALFRDDRNDIGSCLQTRTTSHMSAEAGLQQHGAGLQQAEARLQQHGAGLHQHGAGLQQAEAGLQQHGAGLQQAEVGLQQHGAGLQQAEAGLQQHGAGLQQAEAGLQQHGAGLQQHGARLQQHGAGLQQAEAGLQQHGPGLQQHGAGLQQDEAGPQKDEAGLHHEESGNHDDSSLEDMSDSSISAESPASEDVPLQAFGTTHKRQNQPSLTDNDVQAMDRADATHIPLEVWFDWALPEQQRAKEMNEIVRRNLGMQTVLCVDTSESMKGDKWRISKDFITAYLNNAKHSDVEEYFALITFGHETKVQHHFTLDFDAIQQTVDGIEPEGPTTLYGGLLMTHAVVRGGAVPMSLGLLEIEIRPRVVFVTDGWLSPCGVIAGPDNHCCWRRREISLALHEVRERVERISFQDKTKMYTVPVGYHDKKLLSAIARWTGGVYLKTEDLQTQFIRSAENYQIASSSAMLDDDFSILKGIPLRRPGNPYLTDKDKEDIKRILGEHEDMVKNRQDDRSIQGYPNMPPVGSRVSPGPDWATPEDLGTDRIGTIIGLRTNGYIRVQWDLGDKKMYKYGLGGTFEVILVDEPRIPKNYKDFKVGCLVKEGPDWVYLPGLDVKEEPLGVIYRVEQHRHIWVREIATGNTAVLRTGHAGEYKAELSHPNGANPHRSSQRLVAARGRDARRHIRSRRKNKNRGTQDSEEVTQQLELLSAHETITSLQSESLEHFFSPEELNLPSASQSGQRLTQSFTVPPDSVRGEVPHTQPLPSSSTRGDQALTVAQGHGDTVYEGLLKNLRTWQQTQAADADAGTSTIQDSLSMVPPGMDFVWQHKTQSGWENFSIDTIKNIEAAYVKDPKVTATFYMAGQPYKAVPELMEVIHLPTKRTISIRRLQ